MCQPKDRGQRPSSLPEVLFGAGLLSLLQRARCTSSNVVPLGCSFDLRILFSDSGPRGWLVGKELLGNAFYLTTKQVTACVFQIVTCLCFCVFTCIMNPLQEAPCPAGIVGAWGTTSEKDHSFSIECHSDQVTTRIILIILDYTVSISSAISHLCRETSQVKFDCCKTISLKADPSGVIATHQGGVIGDYVKVTHQPSKDQAGQSRLKALLNFSFRF